MPSKMASVKLGIGFSPVPFGVVKASESGGIDTKSLCECGGTCSYLENEDGHKVECTTCGTTYPWWNSVPQKGYEIGDEYVPIDPDEIPDDPPVETGQVEKVVPATRAVAHYAVTGNYYLTPEDGFEQQYGALVAVLNDKEWAMLTYLQLASVKTRRYAVVSEYGVLVALELADKKALPSLDVETDDAMEQQAASMLDGMVEDDPELPDVEGQALKELVRERVAEDADDEEEEAFAEV